MKRGSDGFSHRIPAWARRSFQDWPATILRPIVVTLTTAFLFFLVALLFKPLILDLIHGRPDPGYPIICVAEPYAGATKGELLTDFFIINRLEKTFTRQELLTELRVNAPSDARPRSPDIVLQVQGGEPFDAAEAEDFNRGKGTLLVRTSAEDRSIEIRIERIERRAIMKVVIAVRDLPFVNPNLGRMAKTQVRFDHGRYLDGCYAK